MNKIFRNITDFIKNRIRLDNAILFLCLLILAFHFYPMAGRFLDSDEEYYFYITSAISKGSGIYTDLNFFYPPVLFFLCSVFFKLPLSLYHSMLAIRIFIVSLSMLSFYLIFDIFKRLKLSWFIIPTTMFIYYSMQFNLKLMEYRSDNALFLILILQFYLIFLLSQKARYSFVRIISIIFLAILAFHVNQKAAIMEPCLFFAFLFCFFDDIKRSILEHKSGFSVIAFFISIYLIFSGSYHRFFMRSYVYPSNTSEVFPASTVNYMSKLDFILFYYKFNPAFWVIGLISFATLLFYFKKNRTYLAPLMFLFGSFLLIVSTLKMVFPYVHYQLYYVWAVLFSLPYFIGLCVKNFPKRDLFIFTIIFLSAVTGIFTFEHFSYPYKPLKGYATEIDRVRNFIGNNGLASFGGSSIIIKSDSPDCYSKDIVNTLKTKGTKFIFIDQRNNIKTDLDNESRYFISSNYEICPDLPLMIASKWVYIVPGQQYINIDIAGKYKIAPIPNKNNMITFDNKKLNNFQIVDLKRGQHSVRSSQPAALLIEFNSDKISSESFNNIYLSNYEFIPLNRLFSGKFELLGVIKYEKSNKLFYHIFWKALSDIDSELMTFHHFCDISGNSLAGVNIDPADGWYDIRSVKKDEVISYDFSIDKNDKLRSLNIGWYFKQDWNMRLRYDDSTFFTLQL